MLPPPPPDPHPPATAYRPIECYWRVKDWWTEPWITSNIPVAHAFAQVISKAAERIEQERHKDLLWVHIWHAWDPEGNRYPMRRLDFFEGLREWVLHFTTTDVDQTREIFRVVRLALMHLESIVDEVRAPIPVPITLSYDMLWGSRVPTWL